MTSTFPAAKLAPMLAAEGLDFGSVLTWWRGPDKERPLPPGSGHVRHLRYAGRLFPVSIFDSELENDWGSALLTEATRSLPLEPDERRPFFDYLRAAIGAGAIVHYYSATEREALIDALLGLVHTVNLSNNRFAPHRFLPRSGSTSAWRACRCIPTRPKE